MKANIIGTGFGARVVAPIYREAGIEVEIVSPRDIEAVKRACAAPVDFISIHSPPFMHRDHVMLALENGRNVVCDKPFGLNADHARDMLAAAEAAGVIHLLNFEFRHEPVRAKAKELIDDGAIGTPYHVQWSAMMAGGRNRPYNWLWDRSLGGGWVGAFGSHAVDALRWWIGEISDVSGVCRVDQSYRKDSDGNDRLCTADDSFSAIFTFANGASATLDTGFTSASHRPYRIEIFGTEGVLIMDFGTSLELKRADKDDRSFTYGPWEGDMHAPALSRWVPALRDAIREGRQIEPSFRDGVASTEILDKLRANATWLHRA